MTNFKNIFYRVSQNKKVNELEPLFIELRNDLHIYLKQYELTLKSYLKEWKIEEKKAIDDYTENKIIAEKVYQDTLGEHRDEDSISYAMHVSGINHIDEHHHLMKDRIDQEYKNFLDLYSKSTLISLYSLNESKLNSITNLLSSLHMKKVKLSHFGSRDYLQVIFSYLELVIELKMDKLLPYQSKLKEVQQLRNSIVHNASILKDSEIKIGQKIARSKAASININSSGFLKITGKSYILDVFNILQNFYTELLWCIDLKQNSVILKNNLQYWIGMMDRDAVIENLKINNTTKEIKVSFDTKTSQPKIPDFKCKISLKPSSLQNVKYLNQTDNPEIEEFCKYEKELGGRFIMDVFDIYNFDRSKYTYSILFS